MAVSVDIDLGYEFTVKAPFKEVFDLVSDVPTSVSHFPKVHKLVDLGEGGGRAGQHGQHPGGGGKTAHFDLHDGSFRNASGCRRVRSRTQRGGGRMAPPPV